MTKLKISGRPHVDLSLLVKLGAIAVHAERLLEPPRQTPSAIKRMRSSRKALGEFLEDAEVKDCIEALSDVGLVPKR